MYHDAVSDVHWARLYEDFPDLQLLLVDGEDRLVAEAHAVPVRSGPDELPSTRLGRGRVLGQAFAGREPRALLAIAITIGVDHRGQGLSSRTMLHWRCASSRGAAGLVRSRRAGAAD